MFAQSSPDDGRGLHWNVNDRAQYGIEVTNMGRI